MPLSYIAFLFAIILVAFIGVACSKTANGSGNPASITRKGIRSLSREQIRQLLKTIETAKAPEPKMGAMCYDMALPPNRAEYVCPKCSDKTLYTNQAAYAISWNLEACRREFELLKKETDLTVTLDESSYCSHCSPAAVRQETILSVTYEDGSTHAEPVSSYDLRMLRALLAGKLEYKTDNDGTAALKEHIARLRQLLGVADKE